MAAFAQACPKGEWILGRGWDEGAWANRYPDLTAPERAGPRPSRWCLVGLHSFAVWGNRLALERAGITRAHAGARGRRDREGRERRAHRHPAEPRDAAADGRACRRRRKSSYKSYVLAGPRADGAGRLRGRPRGRRRRAPAEGVPGARGRRPAARARLRDALGARRGPLPRVAGARAGPRTRAACSTTRSVKAFYDGALGSRGARLLEDYSDRPGHRGVSGAPVRLRPEARGRPDEGRLPGGHPRHRRRGKPRDAGLHRVGASRAAGRARAAPSHRARAGRSIPTTSRASPRLGVIASMEPPHCVEDKAWAEARLGPVRVKGAYAWRTLRRPARGSRLTPTSSAPTTTSSTACTPPSRAATRSRSRPAAGIPRSA